MRILPNWFLQSTHLCKHKKDTVHATIVWGYYSDYKNDHDDVLWSDAKDPLKYEFLKWLKGKFGIWFDPTMNGVSFRIGMQFTVVPDGIGEENMVKFDITRQALGFMYYEYTDPEEEPSLINVFPENCNIPNDDAGKGKLEDKIPVSPGNHIYMIDTPGFPFAPFSHEFSKSMEMNMKQSIFKGKF